MPQLGLRRRLLAAMAATHERPSHWHAEWNLCRSSSLCRRRVGRGARLAKASSRYGRMQTNLDATHGCSLRCRGLAPCRSLGGRRAYSSKGRPIACATPPVAARSPVGEWGTVARGPAGDRRGLRSWPPLALPPVSSTALGAGAAVCRSRHPKRNPITCIIAARAEIVLAFPWVEDVGAGRQGSDKAATVRSAILRKKLSVRERFSIGFIGAIGRK